MKRITDQWSSQLPDDPVEIVNLRLKLIKDCETSLPLRAAVLEACKQDPVFFFSMWVVQANPKHLEHRVGPFIPYPHQAKCIRDIVRDIFIEGEDHGVDKSREEGASWMGCGTFLWAGLFHDNMQLNAISHTEKAVDNGRADSKSLFWKVRFIIKHLPDWMSRGAICQTLSFEFPATKSSFIGEASTGRSAVGGRGPCLLDEVGKMLNAEEIISNTADVGPRLVISTHYATKDGEAYARFISKPRLRRSSLHWSMNPTKTAGLYRVKEKDAEPELLDPKFNYAGYPFVLTGKPGGPYRGLRSKWYDNECERRANARDVAMHLDMDRSGASAQFFDEGIVADLTLQYRTHPRWEGVINYDKSTGKFIGLTRRAGGPLRMWINPNAYERVKYSRYGLGCDISGGTGLTPSCVSIGDSILCEKVAEYNESRMANNDFASLVAALGWLFCRENGDPGLVNWEVNGPGGKFGKVLVDDLQYPNVFRKLLKPPHVPKPTLSPLVGFHSNAANKLQLLEDFRAGIESRKLIVRSEASYAQMPLFRSNKKTGVLEHSGQVAATDGSIAGENHSDMAFADALMWMACCGMGTGNRIEEQTKQNESEYGTRQWRLQQGSKAFSDSTWVDV